MEYSVDSFGPGEFPAGYISAAFALVKQNVSKYYSFEEHSKMKELLKCRHIALRNISNEILAFISFSLEREDEYDDDTPICIYVYELQVLKSMRGKGLGSFLLNVVFKDNRHISSALLTCYTQNKDALKFYYSKGFKRHWTSPATRSRSKYEILFKKNEYFTAKG